MFIYKLYACHLLLLNNSKCKRVTAPYKYCFMSLSLSLTSRLSSIEFRSEHIKNEYGTFCYLKIYVIWQRKNAEAHRTRIIATNDGTSNSQKWQ